MASVTETTGVSAADQSSRSPVAQPLLTVIVPVYNEVNTLETILQRVYESPVDKQIIVVDDGSTDGTADLLRQLAECSPIEAHFHEKNRGKGRAIRTALEYAEGQYTIIQDGDLEYDPQDYPKLLEPLLAGEADVVYGSRYLNKENDFSGRRRFDLGVKLLNFVVWLLYGKRITDEATCYKVFATEALRSMDLQCERFEFCPEVTARSLNEGCLLVEIPIRYAPRTLEDGKKIGISDGFSAIETLWRLRKGGLRLPPSGFAMRVAACLVLLLVGVVAAGLLIRSQVQKQLTSVNFHDFDIVPPDVFVSHTFKIPNVTGEVWTVDKVVTTCQCTVAEFSEPPIPPGGELEVGVTLDTKTEKSYAQRKKDILVQFDNGHIERLTVSADIRDVMVVQPEIIDFGTVVSGEPASTSVYVRYYYRSDLPVPELDTSTVPAWLEVEGPIKLDDTRSKGCWSFAFKLNPAGLNDLRAGGASEFVAFTIPGEGVTQKIPATVQIVAPFQVRPEMLLLERDGHAFRGRAGLHFSHDAHSPSSSDELSLKFNDESMASSVSWSFRQFDDEQWSLNVEYVPTDVTSSVGGGEYRTIDALVVFKQGAKVFEHKVPFVTKVVDNR